MTIGHHNMLRRLGSILFLLCFGLSIHFGTLAEENSLGQWFWVFIIFGNGYAVTARLWK